MPIWRNQCLRIPSEALFVWRLASREGCWQQERQLVRSGSGMLQVVSHCTFFEDTLIGCTQWPLVLMAKSLPAAVMTRPYACGRSAAESCSIPSSACPRRLDRWHLALMARFLLVEAMTRRCACGRSVAEMCSTPSSGITIGLVQWPLVLMARFLLVEAMTRRCACGRS